jgi:hypothetical protein
MLLSAGIPFLDEPEEPEIEEKGPEEDHEAQSVLLSDEDYLANVDASDTIGLYIKEAVRVPLLTALEEMELS